VSAGSGTRLYSNAELGVRFEIDGSFAAGPPPQRPSDLPGDVRSVHLTARHANGETAVLSISRVEAGYETPPHELAEQLVIHNRYAAHTAELNGWTIHSPWKAGMLAGYPAMHCDYVVPEPAPPGDAASGVAAALGPQSPLAASGGEPRSPGHVQAWVAYAGRQTFQVTLRVHPPGDLARNRAVIDTVVRTFAVTVPRGEGPLAGDTSPARRD
jgi:hypothetical protein